MADLLKIDIDSLPGAVASLRDAASSIDATLRTLESKASALMGAWSGEASTAYATAQAAWTVEADSMKTVLDSISTALDGAYERYRSAEDANRDRW
jgi:WXG100 family type VII secretion target